MINTSELPRETKDRLDLLSDTDMTFYRALEEDYTDDFLELIETRGSIDVEHSLLLSVSGMQGSGKCIVEDVFLNTYNRGPIMFKDLNKKDLVLDEFGRSQKIKFISKSRKKCLRLVFDSEIPVECSFDHKFLTLRGLLRARDLVNGDLIYTAKRSVFKSGKDVDLEKGIFYGAYLADGTIQNTIKMKKWKYGIGTNGMSISLIISNNDLKYLTRLKEIADKNFKFSSVSILKASGKGRYILKAYGSDEVLRILKECGGNSADKKIPEFIFANDRSVFGFLSGFSNGDLTCNMVKSKRGTYKTEVGYLIKSKLLGAQFLEILHCAGFWPNVKIRTLRSGKWKGNSYVRITFPSKKVSEFLESMYIFNDTKLAIINYVLSMRKLRKSDDFVPTNDSNIVLQSGNRLAKVELVEKIGLRNCVDIGINSNSHLFQLTGGLLTHNSYGGLAICKMLDPNFSLDNIYFDYNELINNRHKLKPHTAVLVDEQSESYGVDSNRITIILNALKEQLRKKSIHFVFCSPTLKPEYATSMYVIDTMFIDYEQKVCFAAYKTRDLLTLGYIRIPHPLQVGMSREFLAAYEAKKDEHLEVLTGNKQQDDVEERANFIIASDIFKRAEKVYVDKMGYVPSLMVQQIIGVLFPEFKGSIIVSELAARIKFKKEISAEWEVSGGMKSKKKESSNV